MNARTTGHLHSLCRSSSARSATKKKCGHACSDEDELFGAAVGASPSHDRCSGRQATPTASSAPPRHVLPPSTRNRAEFDYSERMIYSFFYGSRRFSGKIPEARPREARHLPPTESTHGEEDGRSDVVDPLLEKAGDRVMTSCTAAGGATMRGRSRQQRAWQRAPVASQRRGGRPSDGMDAGEAPVGRMGSGGALPEAWKTP
ncbi:hypothetical protein BRADI_4g16426v3 [Brachypodium distachyon]|uniref:Uncharacterized protein n=1 Tax=Brachypodium distachyon TaxID=15368 RepID=A0A0Q3L6F2_BRADI|nr:hypothetical protein BRADI_4g16426v3 [Brachypodium distachyon]